MVNLCRIAELHIPKIFVKPVTLFVQGHAHNGKKCIEIWEKESMWSFNILAHITDSTCEEKNN